MGIFGFKKQDKKGQESESKKPEVQGEVKDVEKSGTKKEVKKEAAVKSLAKKTEIKGLTKQAEQVLVRPVVTEKAAVLAQAGKYVFVVDPRMNKIEIKKAIRKIYKVDPTQVNILNVAGKGIRYGRITGRTKNWKKAIVTLKPGDKIEIYEGV